MAIYYRGRRVNDDDVYQEVAIFQRDGSPNKFVCARLSDGMVLYRHSTRAAFETFVDSHIAKGAL